MPGTPAPSSQATSCLPAPSGSCFCVCFCRSACLPPSAWSPTAISHFPSREHQYGLYRVLRNYLHYPTKISRGEPPSSLFAVQTSVSTAATTTALALDPYLRTISDPAGLLRDQSLATATETHRQRAAARAQQQQRASRIARASCDMVVDGVRGMRHGHGPRATGRSLPLAAC